MKKIRQNIISKSIFLCLITIGITTTMSSSKYMSTVEQSDSTRVAAFVVEAVGSGNNIELNCNNNNLTSNYDIIVTNEKNNKVADVGMEYDIIIEFSQALPVEMEISLSTGNQSKTYSGGQTTYTFENVGEFIAGNTESRTHTLNLSTSTNIKDNYKGTLKVFVDVEQID